MGPQSCMCSACVDICSRHAPIYNGVCLSCMQSVMKKEETGMHGQVSHHGMCFDGQCMASWPGYEAIASYPGLQMGTRPVHGLQLSSCMHACSYIHTVDLS